jgi:hypothetical protein
LKNWLEEQALILRQEDQYCLSADSSEEELPRKPRYSSHKSVEVSHAATEDKEEDVVPETQESETQPTPDNVEENYSDWTVYSSDSDDFYPEHATATWNTEGPKTKLTEDQMKTCPICIPSEKHQVRNCKKFLAMSIRERRSTCRDKKNEICYNCLTRGHYATFCGSQMHCQVTGCTSKHHTLLHNDRKYTRFQRPTIPNGKGNYTAYQPRQAVQNTYKKPFVPYKKFVQKPTNQP